MGAVPVGAIAIWAGTIANIPSGWNLCDGTSGTPDLRDKFIRGAPAATEAGTTGGVQNHTHVEDTADEGEHTHTLDSQGAHTHTTGAGGSHNHGAVASRAQRNSGTNHASLASYGGAHIHTTASAGGHTHTTTAGEGAHIHVLTAKESRPPWYDILYVQATITAVIETDIIIIWTGTVANIPTGWAEKTELREKFIRGASNGANSGGTGGAVNHNHVTQNCSGHTHTTDNQGAHNHTFTLDTVTHNHGNSTYHYTNTAGTVMQFATAKNGFAHQHATQTDGAGGHTHTLQSGGIHNHGNTGDTANLPAYKDIVFIKATSATGVPDGGILIWIGTLANIPTNYALCDGTAPTIDLRAKFIRGNPLGGTVGTAAGSDVAHTHTDGAAGIHNDHTQNAFSTAHQHANTDTTGLHNHGAFAISTFTSQNVSPFAEGGNHNHAFTNDAWAHTHTAANNASNHNHVINTYADQRPPFYEVQFIYNIKQTIIARWLTSWAYRRFHQINPATGAGIGYQKRIVAKYNDNWENIRFATEGVVLTPPAGKQFISGQTATYWDGQELHVWVGISDDGTSDTDKIYYTKSGPPFTTWTTPVCVIDLTGSGVGVRDPTSYIEGSNIYLFLQGYTIGGEAGPIKLYKTTKTSDFALVASYTYIGDPVNVGADGEYDEMSTTSPCIMKDGSTYYMMYECNDDDGVYSIGRAKTTDIEDCPWTKDGQLDDTGGNPIVNPTVNTESIVPCVFHDTTHLYVHISRAGGGKITFRGITGDFANNSVTLETYELDPQIDGYWNHNALSETLIDANGFRDRTVYLLGAWSTATYYLRVYIDYDCFSCNTHSQTDFDDIRFTKGDGQTLLDYWLEQKTDSDYAIFWVEIPDSLESNPANIYVYYGNSSATSVSDPAAASLWELGDNFNDNITDAKWTKGEYHSLEGGLGAINEVNNQLEVTAVKSGDEAWYVSTDVVDASDCVIRVKITNTQNLGQMGLWIIPTQYTNVDLWTQLDWYRVLIYGDGNIYIQSKDTGTLYSAAFLATTDVVIIKIVGGHIYFYEQNKDYPWLVYLRADEVYTLADTDVYVYLEGKCDNGVKLGPEIHDDFFSRKMIATEPVQGGWEDEETENSLSIDVIFKKTVVKTESIDTLFKKLGITKTESIDMLLGKLGLTETYSIDVVFKLGVTTKYITYDIDVLLAKQGLTKTASIDALFKKLNITKTNSIDAIFKRLILTKTYSTDILFKKEDIVKIDSTDVLFKKIGITKTYPIDVEIASRLISTNSIDILLKMVGITKTDNIDSLFKKLAIPITDSIDVLFKKYMITKTNTIDILLKKLSIPITAPIDVLFKSLGILKTYPIDVLIALRLTSTDSIDVLFQKTGLIKTDSIDVLFKKLGITKIEQIDVILSKYAVTITDSIDILFKKQGLIVTDSIDVLFKKLEITKTDLVDVRIASRLTSENSIDVLLQKLGLIKTDKIDVLFKKLGITNPILIDIILSRYATTQEYSIDSLFKKMGVVVMDNVDVLFKKLEITKIYLIDVLTAFRLTKTDSIDILFQKLGLITTDLIDVLFASRLTTTDSIDVLLKKFELTITVPVDVLLQKLGLILTYDIDVLIKNLGVTKTYLADLIMQKLEIPVPYYLDVLFKKNEITNSYFIDVIFKSGTTQKYMIDVLIAKLGITKDTSIDVLLMKLGFSETYDIDAILKKSGISLPIIVDTIIKKQNIPVSYSTDVLEKRLGLTRPHSIDILLAKLGLGSYNIDTILKQLNIPISYVINVILAAVVTTNYGIDVVLYKQLGPKQVGYFLDVILMVAKIISIGGGHPIEMDRRIPEGIVKYVERNFNFKVIALKVVSVRYQQKISIEELQIAKRAESKKFVSELQTVREVKLSKSVSELQIANKSSHSNKTVELGMAREYILFVPHNELAIAKEHSQTLARIEELAIVEESSSLFNILGLDLSKEEEAQFHYVELGIALEKKNLFSVEPLSTRKKKMTKRELMDLLNKLDELDK